jgi:hypothetical protein
MKPKPKPKQVEPAVRCAYTRIAELDTLNPNPRNPNQHPPEQLALYWRIVVHQGIRRSIVVSKQSGHIVTGHGLYECLKANGIKTVPIDEQDFKTPADEWAHLLADNRLPQLADLDAAALTALENEISLAGLDLMLTGALLDAAVTPVTMKDVAVQAPPRFTWVLIGIPTVRFGEISERIEDLAVTKEIFLETTCNDGPKHDKA